MSEVASAAMPSGPTVTGLTGARPSATRIPFAISDRVNASVDVGTGNLLVSTQGLSLPGVNSSVPISATYNSLATNTGSTSSLLANGWTYGLAGVGNLSTVTGGLVYTAADGATWKFTAVSGSTTAFTAPAGFNAVLAATLYSGTVSGYTLTILGSNSVIAFDVDGNPTSVKDTNSNTTTITNVSMKPSTVTTIAGPTTARTATFSYSAPYYTLTVTQNSGGTTTRAVQWVKDSSSNLTSFVDAESKTTSFAYTSGKLTSITATTGAVTNITYNSAGQVSQIDQLNTSTGSPGTSTTRFTYPSTTQTLLAGPNTSTSVSVASGPHTTYTLDSNDLVTNVTDAVGRVQSRTYNGANLAPASSTSGATGDGTGLAPGVSTSTYGANSSQSLTGTTSPGGSTSAATYTNTTPATQYQPNSTTDDSGNSTTYTYNGTGNQLTSSTTAGSGGAVAANATLTYNTDGTVNTAAAPANPSNVTTYGYTNHQVTSVTPPTGTSLGSKATTYDVFGRPATTTDGKGVTLTFGYDKDDRLLSTTFSGSTHSVVNTYDVAGRLKTTVDGSGTLTNTYDQLGRLTATVNTAGGGTEAYAYDQASNLISTTDTRGTSTYAYDASNVALSITYTKSGGSHVTNFLTDTRGHRTDEWLQANTGNTVWAGHTHTTFDNSGRIVAVLAQTGPATGPSTVMNVTYSYNPSSTGTTCQATAPASGDRSKLQSSVDNLTGITSVYCYDGAGRLLKVAQTGTGASTYTYTYDANGNRLTAVVTGATSSSQTLTYNAANQITTTGYTYDGAGNLTASPTASYTYNGAEQMTSATLSGVTTTYTYAGTGQNRVLSESNSSKTYTLTYGRSDSQGQPVIEQYGVGSVTAYVENDPRTGQPVMLHTSNDIQGLYVVDGVGNPIGLLLDFNTNSYNIAYDPYGTPNLTAGGTGNGYAQNPYLFKGGIQDRASGLVKFGARWYDTVTGRWTQQDTLDAPLDVHNGNRYAYAGDDPINNLDLSGKSVICQYSGVIVGLEATEVAAIELAGVVLDVTGFAAPAGIALNVAGAALGLDFAAGDTALAFGCESGLLG